MPASRLRSLWPAVRASVDVLVLLLILWFAASAIAENKRVLALYDDSLGTIPAYLYLEALAKTLDDHSRLVLLVGPSTVREGFDTNLMNELVPGTTFINAGVTSPGTMPHEELLVDIIGWYDIHVDELVLGLNSRMLASRLSPIAATRYVDAIKYPDGLQYLQYEVPTERAWALEELDFNYIWPMRRIGVRLDYLIRYALFNLNEAISWKPPLSRADFERTDDPLENRAGFSYSETSHQPELLREYLQAMEDHGLLHPSRYGGRAQLESMWRTLQKASKVADRVTVVVMPEHSVVRSGFGTFGDRAFYSVLREFQSRGVRVIDRRAFVPDEQIRDLAHLVPEGRAHLSREIAAAFAHN